MFFCTVSNSSHKIPFSTSSSLACVLVTGEKLTFSEVSDDLITTKPKGQSNFQTSSSLNLSTAFVTFNHLLFLKCFLISAPHSYLVESGFLHCLQYIDFSCSFLVTRDKNSKVYYSLFSFLTWV